ncbi:MAG: hypothetical protein E7436_07580 [Ruminococcaceae bacterium]|nr:hypothetical protein [Oscillospiraceae bacterium]
MKKGRFIHLVSAVLGVAIVILNATPNCVLMRFMGDPAYGDAYYYSYHSGFSMVPAGYAVWGAMLAGIGGGVLTLLSLFGLFRDGMALRRWQLGVTVGSLLAVLSLLIVGSMTYISGIISVLLASEAVLLFLNCRKEV